MEKLLEGMSADDVLSEVASVAAEWTEELVVKGIAMLRAELVSRKERADKALVIAFGKPKRGETEA